MPKVFGTDVTGHPLEAALCALLKPALGGGTNDDVAMEWNFRNDWRVSETREKIFLHGGAATPSRTLQDRFDLVAKATGTKPATPNELRDKLKVYFEGWVRFRKFQPGVTVPDFDEPALNRDNQVQTLPNSPLVSILDVGGLFKVFSAAIDEAKSLGTFRELSTKLQPTPLNAEQLVDLLDKFLLLATQREMERWSKVFIDVLIHQCGKPFHPVWATTLDSFSNALTPATTHLLQRLRGSVLTEDDQKQIVRDADPRRWLEILGIPKLRTNYPRGTWLIVVCYPAHHAKPLYRPTMLDTDWFPKHLPSPCEAKMKGHPINLGTPARALVPEFIHPQFKMTNDYFLCIKRLPGPLDCNLPKSRTAHIDLLRSTYRTTVWTR